MNKEILDSLHNCLLEKFSGHIRYDVISITRPVRSCFCYPYDDFRISISINGSHKVLSIFIADSHIIMQHNFNRKKVSLYDANFFDKALELASDFVSSQPYTYTTSNKYYDVSTQYEPS